MTPTKEQSNLAKFFFALAHKRRQMLCLILLNAGPIGLTFGSLQRQSRLSAATLSHHLHFMSVGGVLRRHIKGTETWLTLDLTMIGKINIEFGAQMLNRQTSQIFQYIG